MEIKGTFADAKIFASLIEEGAINQIKNICNNSVSEGSSVRIMPDVHPGQIVPVGFTMTLGNKIIPSLTGIDIGCGVTAVRIAKHRGMEYKQLDKVIRENVPAGFSIRKEPHRFADNFDFSKLSCARHIRKDKAAASIGTLGGGNHFIEIDTDGKDFYIIEHSGSRSLGREVTEWYMNCGRNELRMADIQVPYELTYLEGTLMQDYLHDTEIVQKYAEQNRLAIIDVISKGMKWKTDEPFSSVHNYIDFSGGTSEKPVLRKGAVSAKKGEKVIIPVNMKDGTIIGTGCGNADWNYSAPHGSGRVMKREDVGKSFTVSAFKAEMEGIYSSCIDKGTLDEAPFAYRRLDDIAPLIEPSVSIEKILKPVYNFKAGGEA
ncbi:MAG: RtcB family protein [Spirochaetaceae bacterium]|nr:RtcB family protein [Spirochaetaceae bacterium]